MQMEIGDQRIHEAKPQDDSTQSVCLLDIIVIILKRKRFIFWFTLAVTLAAAIGVLLVPNRYTAETVVLPPGQNSSMGSALLSQLGGSGALASIAGAGLGIKNTSDMYISLFRGRTIEDAMVRRCGLMARYRTKNMTDARVALEDHATVILGPKDGLIRIDVTDRDPVFAAELANAYVDEFRKSSAGLAITEASQRRAFFQQQLLEANENLSAAEEAMKHTEQSTGVLQIDSQAKSLIDSAASLRGQVAAKEVQIQAMRLYATEDNPQMAMVNQQLTALKAQLAKLSGTNDNSNSDIIVPKGNIPEAGMEYVRKLRDVKYYETISELIAQQFEMAKLDEARQGAIVQVVDVAVVPDKKSYPHRSATVLVIMWLSLFAACGWCLLAEELQHLKSNPDTRQRLESLRAASR
jgi:tyrosine-protein kinase Etk/Wzc